MAFLQRLASGLKEGIASLSNGGDPQRKGEPSLRTLSKQTSRGKRPSSVSFGFLEAHIRDAIASFVQDKFDKGEAKPSVFTQFWLQFPKLEAGFEVLRRQLEARTGSREGVLPLAVLQSSPQDFGIDESSAVVRELCGKAVSHKCTDIDFVGLVMLLLVVHLTEPAAASADCLHPDVRTMLSCLELAFTHFNSARRGKLDKREVAEALQYESAKAHMKEGARGRTSNRLAHRLFEGLDWEHDNTISFENFLRGILQLVQDEFGDMEEEGEEDGAGGGESGAATRAVTGSGGTCTPSSPPLGAAAAGSTPPRRCGSGRVDNSGREGSYGRRPRSASATGMVTVGSPPAQGTTPGPAQGQRQGQEPPGRSPGSFLASLRNSLRKSIDMPEANPKSP